MKKALKTLRREVLQQLLTSPLALFSWGDLTRFLLNSRLFSAELLTPLWMILGQHNMNIQPAYLQVRKNVRSIWPNSFFFYIFATAVKRDYTTLILAWLSLLKKTYFPLTKLVLVDFCDIFQRVSFRLSI